MSESSQAAPTPSTFGGAPWNQPSADQSSKPETAPWDRWGDVDPGDSDHSVEDGEEEGDMMAGGMHGLVHDNGPLHNYPPHRQPGRPLHTTVRIWGSSMVGHPPSHIRIGQLAG